MATRFYINRLQPAPQVTPPSPTNWSVHVGLAKTLRMSTSKVSAAFSSEAFTYDAADDTTNDWDSLGLVLVGPPMAAQSINNAQRVKVQIRAFEGTSLNNLVMSVKVYVIDQTGTAVGTLMPITRAATEFNTSFRNALFNVLMPGTGPTSFNAYDRLVVELGSGGRPTAGVGTNGHNWNFDVGDSGGSDLPEDDTTTTQLDPWINFGSDTWTFLPDDVFLHDRQLDRELLVGHPGAVGY